MIKRIVSRAFIMVRDVIVITLTLSGIVLALFNLGGLG